MKFGAPKKSSNITFHQKRLGNNNSYINFNVGPQPPASNTQLIVECLMQGKPKKHQLVFLSDGIIKTRKV